MFSSILLYCEKITVLDKPRIMQYCFTTNKALQSYTFFSITEQSTCMLAP